MNIYVLGICGTFMSGIAQLAIQKGFKVSGCDENIYPPTVSYTHLTLPTNREV